MLLPEITNPKFNDDDCLISCAMDGEPVKYRAADWGVDDFLDAATKSRAFGKAAEDLHPNPIVAIFGYVLGGASAVASKKEGYYNVDGNLIHEGAIYRSDL